jgi:predicted RNA-binding protein with RPS1 domain
MSEYTNPISTAFELQRSTIEQGQQAFEQSLDLQQNVNRAVLGSMDAQEDAQRKGVEMSRKSLHTYLDAVEATVPGSAGAVEEVRTTVDEQYDGLLDAHEEAFETAENEFEAGVENYDEMADEYLETFSSQVEMLLDAHEEVEAQTIDVFDQTIDGMEELQVEMEGQTEQFQERFEEQAKQFQERFEEQTEQFQAQFEEMQEQFEEMQELTTESNV